jgi:aspartate/methionine/tyrosine aminotransferase
LRSAFTDRTRAIVLCNPNNPVGKVFRRAELELIAGLCRERDVLCFTDEIYEHILYDRADGTPAEHLTIAALEGMRERTVVINSLSKTYSVTGWRVGYSIAPHALTGAIRKVHDFLTVGAAAPLQAAGAYALDLPPAYYEALRAAYRLRRDLLVPGLRDAGFGVFEPEGAYYVMADCTPFDRGSDVEFARYLAREIGVACVPGSSFYAEPLSGASFVRFCFCKKEETLLGALDRLARLRA